MKRKLSIAAGIVAGLTIALGVAWAATTVVYRLDIDMTNHRVMNLAVPAADNDAARRVDLSMRVADWPIATVRYYCIDGGAGSDANVGYSDTSMPDCGAKAWATIAKLRTNFPRVGANRKVAIVIASGTYAEDFDVLNGVVGYGLVLVRGTGTNVGAGSVKFANDAADKAFLGAQTALAGPNGDGSWTIAAGATTSVFSVAAGTLTAETALLGKTVRFKGDVTASLANTRRTIWANTSSQITLGRVAAAAPADGDDFFIEEPGVRLQRVQAFGSQGGAVGQSSLNSMVLAGLASTVVDNLAARGESGRAYPEA